MKSALSVIFSTIVLDLVGFGMVMPLLPLYAARFGASAGQIGLLFAAYSLMQFFFAPLWGRLSDSLGRRPILILSVAGSTIAWLLFARAPTYAALLAARLFAGLCAANLSVASAAIADVTKATDRARGMGLVGAAFGVGFVLGPFLGGELSHYGMAAPPLAAAALSGVNLLATWLRFSETLEPARRRSFAYTFFQERWVTFQRARSSRSIFALIFVQVLGFSMLEVALIIFVQARLNLDGRGCGRLLGYVGIIMVVLQGGLIGQLSRRVGERSLIIVGFLALALGMAAVPATSSGALGYLLGVITLVALGQGLTGPTLLSLLSRRSGADAQGEVMGVSQSLSALARVLGPLWCGLLLDGAGIEAPFYAGAVVLLVAFFAACVALPTPATLVPKT